MWKFAAAIVLLVVMFSIAILSDRPLPRADLVIINRGEVNTLDAQRMSWLQDLRASAMLFGVFARAATITSPTPASIARRQT